MGRVFPGGGNRMITGLPQDFLDAINSPTRKPVQLIHFMLPGETFYLSDRRVGVQNGLEHDYEPWIESWNTVRDNAFINAVLDGSSLEIKAGTLTLLASTVSKTFIRRVFSSGAENIEVHLYQWFEGMTSLPVLDDIMVCQDPINYSEASMLVNIDLVSVLMISDKHLWPQSPGHSDYPVVIGKAPGLPLVDLQTARWTELVQDMTFNVTGDIFIENGIGFAASGTVSIDSEDMTYSAITASIITITARAQNGTTGRPHYRGARVIPYGAVYDYAICAGPVNIVDNLKANGVAYVNPVTFLTGQNPVIARFTGRPPWLRIEAGADGDPIIPDPVILSNQVGVSYEQHYGNGANGAASLANINGGPGLFATLSITNTVAGGAGSFSRYSQAYISNNLGFNDYTKVQGSVLSNGMTVATKSGFFGNIVNGAKGSIDAKYGYVDSSYGNLTGLSATVKFGINSDIIQSNSIVRVILVRASGALETLQEWADDGSTRFFGDGYRPLWYNVTKVYNISGVNNFTDLANTRIRIELENVTSKTYAQYGVVEDRCTIDVDEISWNVSYFIPAGTVLQPYQEVVAHFNRDLSSLGAITNVRVGVERSYSLGNPTYIDYKVVKRSTSNIADDTALYSISNTSSSTNLGWQWFNLGSMTAAALQALRVGVYHKIVGPTTEGSVRQSTLVAHVWWEITYQPGQIETPDELRVTYADELICDVTSGLGANPTPPEVIQYLIEQNSPCGAFIDAANFAAAHAEYDAEGYYLNGTMSPGTRLHDALKIVLSEGVCRFLFSQGKIRLITAFSTFSVDVDAVISNDNIQLRSRNISYPPTSNLLNHVTVSYNRDLTTNIYQDEYVTENTESIARYYLKDYRKELTLIKDSVFAEFWADRYLGLMATPSAIFSLSIYMPAYIIEKGDRISIKAFFDGRITVTGSVLSISRVYGQGKNNQINLFNVQIFNPTLHGDLDLLDNVFLDDSRIVAFKGLILPTEVITIDDTGRIFKRAKEGIDAAIIQDLIYLSNCAKSGYGSCGYGQFNYGE
jgi:hypothetical protein